MKKKLFSLLTLTIISSVLFVGCGNDSTDSDKAGDDKSSKNGEKVQIEYWHVNAENQGGKTVDELVKQFNEQSDTVEVTAKYNPDMYKGLLQNLQAEAATGNSPDVVQIGWAFLDYFSNNFSYITPQEVVDKHFEEDKSFLKDNFLPNVMDLAKDSEDNQVGIPYSLSTPVLYINKDILREAGLDENGPKTWEEVVSFSDTIKEKTGKYGLYIQEPADNWATQAILESNGAKMITDGKASFASEEGINAYQTYADLVLDSKSALHISWDEGVNSFINGEVGMCYTTIARRANIQEGAKFDVASVKSPEWEGKDVKLPAGGCFLAITSDSEEKQKAAWEFEKFLYSVESMAAWTEGTGYVPPRKDVDKDEKGLKKFLEENEMMNAAIEQMPDVVSWTSFPGDAGLEAEQILLDVRDEILNGSVDVKEGLTDSQNKINEILK